MVGRCCYICLPICHSYRYKVIELSRVLLRYYLSFITIFVLPLLCLFNASAAGFWLDTKQARLAISPKEANWQQQTEAIFSTQNLPLNVRIANRLIFTTEAVTLPAELISSANSHRLIGSFWVRNVKQYIWLLNYEGLEQSITALRKFQLEYGQLDDFYRLQPDIAPLKKLNIEPREYAVSLDSDFLGPNGQAFTQGLVNLSQLTSKGVNIAIIDSGISINSPVFRGIFLIDSWDADFNIPGAVSEYNRFHGNKVTSLLWGKNHLPPNDVRNKTSPPLTQDANLIAIKATTPWTSTILSAFMRAEKKEADIINCSWLLSVLPAPIAQYLDYIIDSPHALTNPIIVTAEPPSIGVRNAMSQIKGSILVSSTDFIGQLRNVAWSSSTTIATPSYFMVANGNAGGELFSGTSASTALVSSLVAKLKYKWPEMSTHEVSNALIRYSRLKKVALKNSNEIQTYRALDLAAFINFLETKDNKLPL